MTDSGSNNDDKTAAGAAPVPSAAAPPVGAVVEGLALPSARDAGWYRAVSAGSSEASDLTPGDGEAEDPSANPVTSFVRTPLMPPLPVIARQPALIASPLPKERAPEPSPQPAAAAVPHAPRASAPQSAPSAQPTGTTGALPAAALSSEQVTALAAAPLAQGMSPSEVYIADLKLNEIKADRLERELAVLRRELNKMQSTKRSTDLELLEARRAASEFEQRANKIRSTISFQLGSTLVESKKSIRAAARLPISLYAVFRSSRALRQRLAKAREAVPGSITQSAETVHLVNTALGFVTSHGGEHAAKWARLQNPKASVLAYTLIEIAKAISHSNALLATALGVEAVDLYPAEHRVKWLAFQLADLGHIRHAVTLINKVVVGGASFNASEARKADHLRALARLIESPPIIPTATRPATQHAMKRVVLYVRETLPHHVSSRALRAQDRAHEVTAAGWDGVIVTPPGYPGESHRALDDAGHGAGTGTAVTTTGATPGARFAVVDGMRHLQLAPAEHGEDITDLYLSAAAAGLAAAAVSMGASVIHADGFYTSGIVAAFAARSAGCPLVLEFDEFLDPHEPYRAGFERTEKGQMSLWMTLIGAQAADVCVVSRPELIDVLAGGGIDRSRVVVRPHAISAARLPDAERAAFAQAIGLRGGPVVGVVRDLCETYDTVVLADVLAGLAADIEGIQLLVVGSGRGGEGLRQRLAEHRLGDRLVMIETPEADRLGDYRALLDVAIFTRHDTLKASMVSAYELSAAMASGAAIVAYRSADAKALIEDGLSGVLCTPGDVGQVVNSVRGILGDRERRRRLQAGARRAYETHLAAGGHVTGLAGLYAGLATPGLALESA